MISNRTTRRNVRPALLKRGAVFVIVLWIATGLVTVALLFGQAMMFAYRAAENQTAGIQSEQAIEGAIRYVSYVLANMDEEGMVPLESDYLHEEARVGDSYFWLIGRDYASVSLQTPVFAIVDESSKMNLNTATAEMLEALPNMTPELAAAIVDWRDEDEDISENGAESETYAKMQPSYSAKNAPFESVLELRMVYGMTSEILLGEDANRNGILDPNENDGDASLPLDNRDGRLDYGLIEYLTVYTSQPGAPEEDAEETGTDASSGDDPGKINVLAEDTEPLSELLNETFDAERAAEILRAWSQRSGEIESLLAFFSTSGMTEDEFAQIENRLAISSDAAVNGLINVNTASEVVLACVPGIGEDKAQEIISRRSGLSLDQPSMAWLASMLESDEIEQAGPYLTGETYQFSVDIAAANRFGKGYRRVQAVIDVSGGEAKILSRRDLTGKGWALGQTTRQSFMIAQESIR